MFRNDSSASLNDYKHHETRESRSFTRLDNLGINSKIPNPPGIQKNKESKMRQFFSNINIFTKKESARK